MTTVTRPASAGIPDGSPVHGTPHPSARPGFWVVPHEPVCPQCGSFDVITDEVDTGDGFTEAAYICEPCGCAWPVACVTEWEANR